MTNAPFAQSHSPVGPTLQPPQAVPFPPAMMNNHMQFSHAFPPQTQIPTASQVRVTDGIPRRYAPSLQSVRVTQSFLQCSFKGCTNTATAGFPGSAPTSYPQHKFEGMV